MTAISAPLSNPTFKMLYIIAIFMIIDGHIGSYDYLSFNGLLRYQNYHIALFMFTSGYFLNLTRGYKDFFIGKLTKLILPLYIWNFIYGALAWYLNTYHGFNLGGSFNLYNLFYAPLTDGHQFIYNMASWFLIPLFLVQSITFIILKPFSETKPQLKSVIFFIFAVVLAILYLPTATTINHGERNLTLTLIRSIYFLPSFALGFMYRHAIEKHDTINTPLYIFLTLSAIYVLTTLFPSYNHVPSWLESINEPLLAIYAISFLSILFWVRIAKILSPLIQNSPTLEYISTHTFDLMMHHFVGFMLIKGLFSTLNATNFDHTSFHHNIWYTYFPNQNESIAILFITITLVIGLLIGFTSRQIYGRITRIISRK